MMSAYANLGHKQLKHVYKNPILETEEDRSLQQANGRTSKKPSPGVYSNIRLGQKVKAKDVQAVTTTSPCTLNSANNRQPKQSLSGVYATLGQRHQDSVYQDLAPTTFQQTRTRKLNQPSKLGVYVNVKASKSRQPLQQTSSEYANITVAGPKHTHNDYKGDSTTRGVTIGLHSKINRLNKTREEFVTNQSTTDVESTEVDNIYDEPNLGDNESQFSNRKDVTGISESGRKRMELIHRTRIAARITTVAVIIIMIVALVLIPIVTTIVLHQNS